MNKPEWLKSKNTEMDKIKANIKSNPRVDLRLVLASGKEETIENARLLYTKPHGNSVLVTYGNPQETLDFKFSELASLKSEKAEGEDWDFEDAKEAFDNGTGQEDN